MPAPIPAHLAAAAINPTESWWAGLHGADARSAIAMLETETSGGRHQRSVYELFAEMEEKDGHLYSVLQTRINGLLGLPRTVTPANDHVGARRVAAFVDQTLSRIPRYEELLRAVLDSVSKGFAVVELLWGYSTSGQLVPVDWLLHPQEFFLFDTRGRLLLLTPPFNSSATRAEDPPLPPAGRTLLPATSAIRPPARKFLVTTFGRDSRNPYGRGLCHRAYWFYWFKKNCLKWWAVFNEKYGAPTAVATYQPGTSEDERNRLLDILQSIQSDAGVVLPESVRLQLLEAAKSGSGETFREMAAYCNDEISKIVLGATLTASEGRRSGSLALGNVHNAVRQDYIESDARALASTINETLMRWLVELNFPPGTPLPNFNIDATPPEDLEQQARIDRELVALGVPIPVAYFHQRYGRPVPVPGERALTYDDSNLFQYHLRYGILTINEVRARLHLPPVPWGNQPAGDNTPNNQPAPNEEKNKELQAEHETTGR